MKPIFKHISLLVAILMVLTVFTGQIATSAKATEFSNQAQTFSAGAYHSVFIWPDGSVGAVGYSDKDRCDVTNWENVISVSASSHTVGLHADGTVVATGPNGYGQCEVSNWSNMVAISAGVEHTVGLCANGAVVAVGKKDNDRCDVSDWEDIVAITAGNANTYGLKSNGKVLAVGSNASGQKDVSGWNNIQQISAGYTHVVGLKENGTVVATGNNSHGQCDVSDWKDIVAISAGHHFTLGLKADGTVVSTGDNSYGQCNVRGWTNIVAISAGQIHSIGLCSDGTLVSTGSNAYGQCNIDKDAAILTTADQNPLFPIAGDVVQVALHSPQCAVLRTDGTVRVIGDNTYGQCNTTHWQNVVKIWVDRYVTFGLTKDGTVLATNGEYSDWTDVAKLFIHRDFDVDESIKQYPAVVALRTDGTILGSGYISDETNLNILKRDYSRWTDIQNIVIDSVSKCDRIIGLKKDGSIEIAASQAYEETKWPSNVKELVHDCNVDEETFAITEDGHVYYIGSDCTFMDIGLKNIDSLNVACFEGYLCGITKNRTAIGTQYYHIFDRYNYYEEILPDFYDIKTIAACRANVIGLREDGAVVSCDYRYPKETAQVVCTDVSKIVEVADWCVVALQNDGTILCISLSGLTMSPEDMGGSTNWAEWEDIVDVWSSYFTPTCFVALTGEGKLVGDGFPEGSLETLTADVKS